MAKFLNTSRAYAEIEDIVDKAKNRVVLISPYIKITEPLLARLKNVDGKGIKIVIVCRKDDLKAEVRNDLKQLKHLELRFDENIHAKCFYNEELIVITSLNLYDYSLQNNREMGILLKAREDLEAFNDAHKEAEFIVENAEKDNTIKNVFTEVVKEARSQFYSVLDDDSRTSSRTRTTRKTNSSGFCLRCGARIEHNLDAPYCRDCYRIWSQYEDPDYEENFCHSCGKPATTSMAKPQCISCYRSGN
jgi:hypothetical protein